MAKIGIIGAGGQARELYEFTKKTNVGVSFTVVEEEFKNDAKKSFDNVVSFSETAKSEHDQSVLIAVGAPAVKIKLEKLWAGNEYFTYVDPQAYMGSNVVIGSGSIVAPGAVITADVNIGAHVLINTLSSISHDCRIGDYSTVSPGVNIGGGVTTGKGVFIGLGASISNGVKIADGCVVGAGAVVVSDIEEENTVVAGVPAKAIKRNEGWLGKI